MGQCGDGEPYQGEYEHQDDSYLTHIIQPLLSQGRRPKGLTVSQYREVIMASTHRTIVLVGVVALAMIRPALTAETPRFQVDSSWPKTLPNNWIFGQIGGVFVDAQDHVWVNQRPGTLDAREKRASTTSNVRCCVPAPPVVEFDQEGNVVQA